MAGGRHAERRPRWRWLAGAVAALVVSTQLPPAGSGFVATTSTGANTFTGGTVAISATATGSKVFSVTGAIPGSTATICVITTYTGSVPATVRMFFPTTAGTLGTFLVGRIQSGTGTQTDCSDFGSPTALLNAGTAPLAAGGPTLDPYLGSHADYANGVGQWSATQGATRAWKFEYLLPATDAARSTSLTFTTTWEARS